MAKIFNVKLTDHQKNILNEIKIDKDVDPFGDYKYENSKWKSFDDKNNIKKIIFDGIKETSSKNSDKICNDASKIISKLIVSSIKKLKKNMNINEYHKIFWLRFERPDNRFKIPRWHADGPYISTNEKKMIISLQGKGTLIAKCKNNKKILQDIKKNNRANPAYVFDEKTNKHIYNEKNEMKNRKLNKSIVENHCKIYQLNNFTGVIYEVGNKDNACLHSEPDKTEPRILLGILVSEK